MSAEEGCQDNHMAACIPKIVALGLDTLYLTARGRVDAELLVALEDSKRRAGESRSVAELENDFGRFGGDPLYVRPYGGGYAYLAFNEWAEFALLGGDGYRQYGQIAGKPTVRARVSSEYLRFAPALAPGEAEAWPVMAVQTANAAKADDRAQVQEAHHHVDILRWEPT